MRLNNTTTIWTAGMKMMNIWSKQKSRYKLTKSNKILFILIFIWIMKKVTELTVNAFKNWENLKLSNTQTVTKDWISRFYLHGNEIAVLRRDCWQLKIWDCGWESNTTKERLNWILSVLNFGYIYQKNWTWYYVSRKWIESKWTGFEEIDINFN